MERPYHQQQGRLTPFDHDHDHHYPNSHSLVVVTLLFLVLSVIILIFFRRRLYLRLRPPFVSSCKCDVCRSFSTRSYLALGFTSLPEWYTHLLHRSPTSTVTIHLLNNVVTANPRNVEHILRTNFDNYPKGRPHAVILGDLLGQGIFVVDGEHWRFQRKLASFELGSASIRQFAFAVLASEVRSRLVPLFEQFCVEEEEVVDLQDVFRRFSFDNICRFSFGIDPGCLRRTLPESEFAAAFDLASKLSAERALETVPVIWKVKRALNIGSERKLRKAVKKVHFLADTIIRERRKMGFSGRRDLLSRFMASIKDEEYLRDIVINFLLAGRDTVSSAITVFFLLLSQNPEVESKIREESDRVLGGDRDHHNIPRYDDLKDMHYLQAAMYEALRLYPPVQIDSKYAVADDTLPDGTRVKGGSKVSYHPYAMGRMPAIWGEDCLEFKPERWIGEDGLFRAATKSAYEFPVFQAGFRVCLGKEMAILAMKVVCLSIVRLFDVRVVGTSGQNQKPDFVPGLTATLRGGLKAVVRKRR